MLRRFTLLCVLAFLWAPLPVLAKDQGKAIADNAAAAFKAQRFEEAAELFEKAFALSDDKFVRLRNAGRAWEEAGKLDYARTQFQRYLEKVPTGPDHDEVAARLTRLEARMAAGKPSAPPTEPVPVEPLPPEPAAQVEPDMPPTPLLPPPPEVKPAPRGWAHWAFMGGGAAVLAAGTTWLVLTETANQRLDEQSAAGLYTQQKLADDRASITRNRIGAASIMGVGVVGIVVGAVLATRDPPPFSAWLTPSGSGLAYSGSF